MSDGVSRSHEDEEEEEDAPRRERMLPRMPITGMRVDEWVWARTFPWRVLPWIVIAFCSSVLLLTREFWPWAICVLASVFLLERNGLLFGLLEYRPLVIARIEGNQALTLIRANFEEKGRVLLPRFEYLPLLAPASPGLALGYAVRDWGRARFLPLSALTEIPALLDVGRVPVIYLRLLERGPLRGPELDALLRRPEPTVNEPAPAWWDGLAQRGTRALSGDEVQTLEGALARQHAGLLRWVVLWAAVALLALLLGARAFEQPTLQRIGACCLAVALLGPLLEIALRKRRWVRTLSRDLAEGQVLLIRGQRDAIWNTGELIRLGVIVGLAPSHIELAVAPHSRFACSFCDTPVLAGRVNLARVGVPSPSEREHPIVRPGGNDAWDFDLFWRRLSPSEREELAARLRRLRPSPAFFAAVLALVALVIFGEGPSVKVSAGVVLGGALLWGGRQFWRERALEKDVELGRVHVVQRRRGPNAGRVTEQLVRSRRVWSVDRLPAPWRLRRFV